MTRFAVSRTVVREAISGLQASALVQTRHGVGTFVVEPSQTGNFRITSQDMATVADVISVLELRISLETEAAGLAAQRRSPANLKALALALQAFQDSIRQDSDAVPGLDERGRLQARDRLAHDRPADREAGHDLPLGRQLVARPELPVADAGSEAVDDLRHQPARSSYGETC